jgi:tetratricopeptide (TPR) repeat protein
MREGELDEAQRRFQQALALSQRLGEPSGKATYLHQLGTVFQRRGQWEEAERHYRESARLAEEGGDLQGAAQTWNQLAILNKDAGRPGVAEEWYRKSIDAKRRARNAKDTSAGLLNLANLLRTQPDRLVEARELADEALKLSQGLDPAAVEIWRHLNDFALIAEQQAAETRDGSRRDQFRAEARQYRRLGIEARINFAGTRHQMQRHLPLIGVVVVAAQDKSRQDELLLALTSPEAGGQDKLVAAVRQILAGERNEDDLGQGLDSEDSIILHFILRGIADPPTLNELIPDEPPAE